MIRGSFPDSTVGREERLDLEIERGENDLHEDDLTSILSLCPH